MRCLAEHARKSAKHLFTKLCRVTSGIISEVAKINFKIVYLIRGQVLNKNQRALLNREKLQKCLKVGSGNTFWQSKPQNLLKINLPNFVG